ncbi:MAG: hypothetical protein GY765_25240 [bacterium]|nr:hypothetical protein [bacterium]
MKSKTSKSKLTLTRTTVANLDSNLLSFLKGGATLIESRRCIETNERYDCLPQPNTVSEYRSVCEPTACQPGPFTG